MKALILGIDALDCELLDQFGTELPNINSFRHSAKVSRVVSTFPPDSDTAWATISTGLNPAQHGIVRFVDPLEKSYQILNKSVDNHMLRGITFWDIVANNGYKTAAIFPHLCYPIWDTSSTIISRGTSIIDVQTNQPELLKYYPDPNLLMGVRGFPERKLTGMKLYFEKLTAQARADAEFALRVMRKDNWELFFVYWSTIDAIGHFFWNYFDSNDPGFVDGHPLQNVILETYKLYDGIIGRFLDSVPDETSIILLSDHGHGARPFRLVNINKVLWQAGYLSARSLKTNPHMALYEKVKRLLVRTISRYGLAKIAGQILRNYPLAIQSFTRPSSINWNKTVAYATDMSGIKAYTYGGIKINKAALNDLDYETTRSRIIEVLKSNCVLPDGEQLLKFISRREDVYTGEYIDNFPDILLEFKYGYGVGWNVMTSLFTHAESYNLVPGSHRGDTGSFIIRSSRQVKEGTINLHDITPTILDLFNVPFPFQYDGHSLLV